MKHWIWISRKYRNVHDVMSWSELEVDISMSKDDLVKMDAASREAGSGTSEDVLE